MLSFEKDIKEISQGLKGNISVYLEMLPDGDIYEFNSDYPIPSASLIKLPILLRLFLDAEEGRLSLDDAVSLDESNRVGGTGILDMLPAENKFPLSLLGTFMIILSDNCATNQLIDILGADRIQALIDELGMKATKLQRKMMDFAAIKAGRNNYTSARDMGHLVAAMASGKCGKAGKAVVNVMRRQIIRDMLPQLLPYADNDKSALEINLPEKGTVLVANKTGNLSDKLHDVAWCRLDDGREYVLSIMSDKLESLPDGRLAIAKISKTVFDKLSKK